MGFSVNKIKSNLYSISIRLKTVFLVQTIYKLQFRHIYKLKGQPVYRLALSFMLYISFSIFPAIVLSLFANQLASRGFKLIGISENIIKDKPQRAGYIVKYIPFFVCHQYSSFIILRILSRTELGCKPLREN